MNTPTKLNVLQFICPTGFYGAERWVLALSKHLPKHVRSDLAVTLETNSKDLELVKHFKRECGDTFELPMKHKFDFGVVNKLVALIKERDIDVIHTHGYKSDILGVMAAKKANIPVIVTPHGFENAADIKLRLFIWMGCKAMTKATAVVPLSKQLCEDSLKAGVASTKLHYIQNGVDLSEVEETRLKPSDQEFDHKRIGFIGQMISRKNIDDILDIFEQISAKHDNLRLYFVGDGDERERLQRLAKTLKSSAQIEFLGFRDDRLALLKSFDLFVMTSSLEGIPRCLMEACAMETPVAAYNIPGIDQLIQHQQTGLLAKFGDKETLASYWEQLLFDTSLAEQLGRNARAYVETHYSAQRMADEYYELFLDYKGKGF